MTRQDSEERHILRNRRSLLILLAGAASLLIPLLGVVYLRITESPGPFIPGNAAHGFARRQTQADRIRVPVAPAMPVPMEQAPPAGRPAPAAPQPAGTDSLGFVKAGSEYYPPPPAQPPAARPSAPEPKAPPKKASVAKAKPKKTAPKRFVQPKLQNSGARGSFSDFKANKPLGAGQAPGAPSGDVPDVGSMLGDIPGVNDPQKTGGIDVGGMLQGIPGVGGKKK
ncbi:MAG TPA: hypothetical protein DEB40_04295 [Elusimicrobia bacterium]|nr:hypothetical protein [Elusimicrobiota bacterium]HBT60945.1 hypothetical protein [Elusimicrobiota bacterium]